MRGAAWRLVYHNILADFFVCQKAVTFAIAGAIASDVLNAMCMTLSLKYLRLYYRTSVCSSQGCLPPRC